VTRAEHVVLADTHLRLRSSLPISDARSFVLGVLAEAERELDRALEDDPLLTLIPQLNLELRVEAGDGTVAREVGRALASRILASVALAQPLSEEVRAHLVAALARNDARQLVQLAGELGTIPHSISTSARAADSAEPSSAAAASDAEAVLLTRLVQLSRPVACLGKIARYDNLSSLAHLTPHDSAAVLRRALTELRSLGHQEAAVQTVSDSARLSHRLLDRARRTLVEIWQANGSELQPNLSNDIIALAAIALAARFGIGAILSQQLWEREAPLSATADTTESIAAHLIAEHEVPHPTSTDMSAVPVSAPEPDLMSEPLADAALREPPNALEPEMDLLDTQSPDLLETISLHSPHAGLAFLLPVLHDLGLPAALVAFHPEPTLVVHRILRRVLERLGLPVDDEDPALFLLAGLLDAPGDDDRDDDAALWSAAACGALARAVGREGASYTESIDAWASALVEESRGRLAEVSPAAIDLTRDVIALRGELTSTDDALEIAFYGFPRAYDALLRTGMLSDIAELDWLDGRALRFKFREEA
jgi:hypothetical protein